MKRAIGLTLIAFMLAGLLFVPQPRSHAQIGGLDIQPPVDVSEVRATLTKTEVFQGESFFIRASAGITVREEFEWRNVASAQFDLIAVHETSQQSLTLSSQERVTFGPFIGLRPGTAFEYQILNIPLQFPAGAAPGQYHISAVLAGIDPQWIWDMVKENVSDISIELGSIKYLGIARPEIGLTLSAPGTVSAGEVFAVHVGIGAPGVEQVSFSLYTQKAGEEWYLIKENISVPGTGSHTESIAAPVYSGELKIIGQARSFTVAGTRLELPSPAVASTLTRVELPQPTLEVSVNNPVELGGPIPVTIIVGNPSASIQKMEVQVQPGWLKTSRNLTLSLKEGLNTFEETVEPPSATGEYSLTVRSSRYLVDGKWINLSPALEASAIVTTGTAPTASLTLQPGAVYPGAAVSVRVEAINPTTREISIPYKVYTGGIADSSQQALELGGRSLWKEGSLTIPAGQNKADTLSYVFTDVSALSGAMKYQGFQLVIERYTVGGTTISLDSPRSDSVALTVKPPLPPLVRLTPSPSSVDAGGPLTLQAELRNPMDVDIECSVEVWERVSTTGAQASLIDRKTVSLGGGQLASLQFSDTAPVDPVQIEYRAQVTEIRISGVGSVPVTAASQTTVTVKSLSLPEITLALNPNPVQAGSSVEAKVIVTNTSTNQDMNVPVNLYLKLPGNPPELWGQEQVSLAAGKSGYIVKHLLIPQEWQDLGSARITAEVAEISLAGSRIVLASPLKASKEFSIINLRLRAILQTSLIPSLLTLSYDAQSKFLVADSVGLDGAILISNAAGWENSPDTNLRVEVTQSQGVGLIEDWKTVEVRTGEIQENRLGTEARFSIVSPTAEGLRGVAFQVKVTAGTGIENSFSLGITRIEGADWYLDAQARLISKATGQAFLGSIPGASLPQAYLDALAAEKTAQLAQLLSEIDSFAIDVQILQGQVEGGATIMPSAQKAWDRLWNKGSSLKADLELLKERGSISQTDYSANLQELEQALQSLEELEGTIADKYGDGPTPRQFTSERFYELVGGSDPSQLSQDPDQDGLSTLVELGLGYDPYKWDSQRQGMSDGDFFAASLTRGEDGLLEEEGDFLGAYASLYLLDSIGSALEDSGDYVYFSSSTREDLRSLLQDTTWDFCQYLLGLS